MAEPMRTLLRELDDRACRPVVVASHPRSGTHLCIDALRLNFPAFRSRKRWFERADRLYLGLDAAAPAEGPVDLSLIRRIMSARPRPLVKTHALPGLQTELRHHLRHLNPELAEWLNERAALIYMYRDGRQALCSLWRYMQGFDIAARVPFSHFLRQQVNGMNRAAAWAHHVRSFVRCETAHCVAMERLLRDPDRVLLALADRLDVNRKSARAVLPPECGVDLLSRLKRRIVPEPPSTAIATHPRVQRFGNWRQVFLPADRQFFHCHAGDMLVEFGYESSDAWVDPCGAGPAMPVRLGSIA